MDFDCWDLLDCTFAESKESSDPASTAATNASIIDAKRVQQVESSFQSLGVSLDSLIDMVTAMDQEALTQSLLATLEVLAPSADELYETNSMDDADADLGLTRRIFKRLGAVPRLAERLEVQAMTFTWDEEADILERQFKIVNDAGQSVCWTYATTL